MKATGLFFLRMRACLAAGGDGQPTLQLPVVERERGHDGHWVTSNELLATWRGPQATAFWNLHFAELVAGRGLELELDRLRARDNEIVARVTRCALAPLPPSWQKAAAAPTTPPPQALAA